MARRHASTEGRRYVCSLTTRADSNSAAFRARQGPLAACGGALARSIGEVGLLHPVVVTSKGHLVAGARRLEACRILGWKKIPVTVLELPND